MRSKGDRPRQRQAIVTKAMTEGEGYDPELAMAALREVIEREGLAALNRPGARDFGLIDDDDDDDYDETWRGRTRVSGLPGRADRLMAIRRPSPASMRP